MSPPGEVVRFRLSSALVVEAAGRSLAGGDLGSRKARTLLAVLAASGGAASTDRLVEALWPEAVPADPAANVATLVSRARRTLGPVLGPDLLLGTPGSYRLGGTWTLDLTEASQLAAEAGTRLGSGEHALAEASAAAALDLLGPGPALADEGEADWVLQVRREADGLRREARHHRVVALLALDPGRAVSIAADGVAADRFDERAARDHMQALAADGRAAAALVAYDALVDALRDELGTDPSRATADLHLALLREVDPVPEAAVSAAPRGPADPPALVGREPELVVLRDAWRSAVAGDGRAGVVLVVGEGGIGKTGLLEAVAASCAATGGQVLRGRCHPAERSLFLQPYVDALRPLLSGLRPDALLAVVHGHEAAWVALLPDLAQVVRGSPAPPLDHDLHRRATYDAVVAALRRLSGTRPVVLVLDDLQDAGAATVDLLGHLAGRLGGTRVLLVGAVRSEDPSVAERLGDRVSLLRLGPLPAGAVEELAVAAGLPSVGEQVMARTAGHTLSVVESLRALRGGEVGVPASLAAGVRARVDRLGPGARAVVEAGAVLRRRLDPRLLGALTETSEVGATRHGEELVLAGLFARSGAVYEFANDLLQECVYAGLPEAVAAAYHRRAADLTADRPEVMAGHAHAVGDDTRAARGWLLAGEAALLSAAVEDARDLVERCLAVPSIAADTRARALLVRARVHEARTSWTAAIQDVDAALAWARASGERRLELAALRARGGDAAIGAQLGPDEIGGALEDGLQLAATLGDRRAEADFACRLSVLEASRLQLSEARGRAERAIDRARAAGSHEALLLALDGSKTVAWYLGDAPRLASAIEQIHPLLAEHPDPWLHQWVVFESAFVPAAHDDWAVARERLAEALELNRRSGFPAYAGWLTSYQAWLLRLEGDLDEARRLGRAAVEATSAVDHPWWHSWAAGLLAATLVETGDHDEAVAVARAGLAARSGTARPGRLLCAATLAAMTGESTREATEALDRVDCPPGAAWVLGADAYLLLAGAARRRGDEEEADRLVAPLRAATSELWPAVRARVEAASGSPGQSTSSTIRAARSAPSDGTGR
ncbi:Predicted ATPase [Nocardioides exalbidus]|uniref:Predicted ATPase n=1 Tax=Nocardioides exalbidus TaxID=402596 RepID=A0A1H4X318_9ACTN|nr:AAA family ATPase [Nocardioides exalbidus]SEC99973.1 Predicted ATPase [Nocardioides exalbidus]